jgi:glucose-6-phosphate dehydrogenase assembly protein OpcA
MAAVANEIERGNAVVIAGNSFAVDDAGARAQACQRLDNQREAMGEVIARTAVESHLCAGLAGNDPEAVVLHLMQPLAA